MRLSTGELGVVSALHEDTKQRPIVRVIRTSEGQLLPQPYEVDLKRQLDLMICGVGSDKLGKLLVGQPEQTERRLNKVFHLV
ncbi:hypothetical protein [Cohnella luojiensis]|uniref:Uncharacterized protein n=1 Tax=Cohnella luojiensis TaxID=652876 RepID=A0A4Y8LTE2_9BACL|nr:hypothetical protein [Cohnella luojiensis]TFE23681.1 hypothetical protein E2980_18590 [Cohnella luojiensis]